jgi:hypothetical protein
VVACVASPPAVIVTVHNWGTGFEELQVPGWKLEPFQYCTEALGEIVNPFFGFVVVVVVGPVVLVVVEGLM